MTYPDFDALDPQRALVFLPMDGQFQQKVGNNLLTNGDFSAGTAGWSPLNSALSVEPDATHGQALKVSSTGTGYYATQNAVISADLCGVYGWARGDGSVGIPTVRHFLGSFWLGTNSTSWQKVSGVTRPILTQIRLGSTQASGMVYFAGMSAFLIRQATRSLSKVPGAKNYSVLGDGKTETTFPTQRSDGRGMTFDTGDWIDLDWAAGGVLDTQTFTVCALLEPTIPAADGRIYEVGIAGQRYSLFYDLSEGTIVWQKDDTVDQTITSGYGYPDGQVVSVAATISQLGMELFVNDKSVGSISGDVRLSSFDASSKAFFGQDVAAGNRYAGNMIQAAVHPFAFNPTQVREWSRRARQARNI